MLSKSLTGDTCVAQPSEPAHSQSWIHYPQTPSAETPLIHWTADQIEALCEELEALGYEKSVLMEEYRRIQAEKDAHLRDRLSQQYHERYTSMALSSLRCLARRSKSLRTQQTARRVLPSLGAKQANQAYFQIT